MGTIASLNGVDDANISSVNGQTPNLDLSGSASTAPSVSVSGGTFGVITATITKSGGGTYTNPNYSAECALADGTVTVTDANIDRALESDKSHLTGTLNFADSNASTAQRTISVKAQEFGDSTQSSAGTATYTPSFIQAKYIRLELCEADGTVLGGNSFPISDIGLYTGPGQTGTEYPTTALTSATSETGIVVSAGHEYNTTNYAAWKAADSGLTTWWWGLGSSAGDNWWQIEFEDGTYGTKPIIKSLRIRFYGAYGAEYFKITSSANADHSSSTNHGVFKTTYEGIGNWTSYFNLG